MHIGHYISGAGHLGLIGIIMFGGVFRSDPPPLEVTEVAVFSEAEFAALMRPSQPPESTVDVAAPPAPEPTEETPPAPPATNQRPTARPEPVAPPAPESPPQAPEAPQPPPAPEPEPVVEAPDTAEVAVPQPADRVAPVPVAQPEPATPVAPDAQAAVVPDLDAAPEPDPAPEQEAAAPEAAATEIVTEAERPAASRAPASSLRPQSRPARPTEVAQDTPAPEVEAETADPPAETDTDAAVAAALAAALGGGTTTPQPDLPVGPPLTDGERNGLRVAVEACWVVDVGSQAANVTVTVAMSLDQEGRVAPSSLRRVDAAGGDASAIEAAFQAARRAILRCQGDGYDLPREKYDQWKDIEMTFNPEKMRLR